MSGELVRNLNAIKARAYVRIVGQNREPSWLFFDTILPLLPIASYVFFYRSLNAAPDFAGFVVLGGAMISFWMNVLWNMASQFYWEKMSGNLELLMAAPVSRMSILAGMALGGMFTTFLRAGVTLLLGLIVFQVPFSVHEPGKLILVFVLTLVALYGLGMMFASLYLVWGREAWHTSNLLSEPVYLVSGFYFPVSILRFPTYLLGSMIPLTFGLDAIRQLCLQSGRIFGLFSVDAELLFLAALSFLYIAGAGRSLAVMERLARREGRITLRWQ